MSLALMVVNLKVLLESLILWVFNNDISHPLEVLSLLVDDGKFLCLQVLVFFDGLIYIQVVQTDNFLKSGT